MTTSIQETTFIGKSFDIDLPSEDSSAEHRFRVLHSALTRCGFHGSPFNSSENSKTDVCLPLSTRLTRLVSLC